MDDAVPLRSVHSSILETVNKNNGTVNVHE